MPGEPDQEIMLRRAGLCRLLPAVVRRIIPRKFHDARATGFACRLVHAGSRQPWRFGHDAGIGLTGIREQRGPEAASASGSRQRALRHGIRADARVDRKMLCCGGSAGMPAVQGPLLAAQHNCGRNISSRFRRGRSTLPPRRSPGDRSPAHLPSRKRTPHSLSAECASTSYAMALLHSS